MWDLRTASLLVPNHSWELGSNGLLCVSTLHLQVLIKRNGRGWWCAQPQCTWLGAVGSARHVQRGQVPGWLTGLFPRVSYQLLRVLGSFATVVFPACPGGSVFVKWTERRFLVPPQTQLKLLLSSVISRTAGILAALESGRKNSKFTTWIARFRSEAGLRRAFGESGWMLSLPGCGVTGFVKRAGCTESSAVIHVLLKTNCASEQPR